VALVSQPGTRDQILRLSQARAIPVGQLDNGPRVTVADARILRALARHTGTGTLKNLDYCYTRQHQTRYVAGARLCAGAALKHLDYSKRKKKMQIPARPELPLPAV